MLNFSMIVLSCSINLANTFDILLYNRFVLGDARLKKNMRIADRGNAFFYGSTVVGT